MASRSSSSCSAARKRTNLGRHFLDLRIFGSHPYIGVRIRPGSHQRFEHVETLHDLIHAFAGQIDHVQCSQWNAVLVGKGLKVLADVADALGLANASSRSDTSASSGSSVSIALTGPIAAGDIDIDR